MTSGKMMRSKSCTPGLSRVLFVLQWSTHQWKPFHLSFQTFPNQKASKKQITSYTVWKSAVILIKHLCIQDLFENLCSVHIPGAPCMLRRASWKAFSIVLYKKESSLWIQKRYLWMKITKWFLHIDHNLQPKKLNLSLLLEKTIILQSSQTFLAFLGRGHARSSKRILSKLKRLALCRCLADSQSPTLSMSCGWEQQLLSLFSDQHPSTRKVHPIVIKLPCHIHSSVVDCEPMGFKFFQSFEPPKMSWNNQGSQLHVAKVLQNNNQDWSIEGCNYIHGLS